MDIIEFAKELPMTALHAGLTILVYVLWKRQTHIEKMLIECLQNSGKVDPAKVDALDNVR